MDSKDLPIKKVSYVKHVQISANEPKIKKLKARKTKNGFSTFSDSKNRKFSKKSKNGIIGRDVCQSMRDTKMMKEGKTRTTVEESFRGDFDDWFSEFDDSELKSTEKTLVDFDCLESQLDHLRSRTTLLELEYSRIVELGQDDRVSSEQTFEEFCSTFSQSHSNINSSKKSLFENKKETLGVKKTLKKSSASKKTKIKKETKKRSINSKRVGTSSKTLKTSSHGASRPLIVEIPKSKLPENYYTKTLAIETNAASNPANEKSTKTDNKNAIDQQQQDDTIHQNDEIRTNKIRRQNQLKRQTKQNNLFENTIKQKSDNSTSLEKGPQSEKKKKKRVDDENRNEMKANIVNAVNHLNHDVHQTKIDKQSTTHSRSNDSIKEACLSFEKHDFSLKRKSTTTNNLAYYELNNVPPSSSSSSTSSYVYPSSSSSSSSVHPSSSSSSSCVHPSSSSSSIHSSSSSSSLRAPIHQLDSKLTISGFKKQLNQRRYATQGATFAKRI